MSRRTAIRVGSDVLSVHQVTESVARFGDRYLQRVYTEHEINSSTGSATLRAALGRSLRCKGSDYQSLATGRSPARLAIYGGSAPCRRVVHNGTFGPCGHPG